MLKRCIKINNDIELRLNFINIIILNLIDISNDIE